MKDPRRIVLLAMVAVLATAVGVAGQSGRRFPKQPRQPIPEPAAATPVHAPAPPVERKKPETAVRVFSNIQATASRGFADPKQLHIWTVDRLRRVLSLETIDGGSADRSKAVKEAKTDEDGAYVVLLDLQSDPFQSSMSGRSHWIDLMIFSPTSGKLKGSRRLEIGQSRSSTPGSRNVLLSCYPGAYGAEILLLEASIDAADFVLSTFNMPSPPICGPRPF